MKNYINMVVVLFVTSAVSAIIMTFFDLQTRERIENNKKEERLLHILKTMRVLPVEVKNGLATDKKLLDFPEATAKDRFLKEALLIERTQHYLKKQTTTQLMAVFSNQIEILEVDFASPEQVVKMAGKDFLQAKTDYLRKIYIFKTKKEDNTCMYCFEVSGAGFWDKIAAYMAMKEGFRQIGGISFYDHKETPGLGQRIEEGWFQAQFTHWNKQAFADESSTKPELHVTGMKGVYLGDCGNKKRNEVDAITGASETSRALDRFIADSLRTMLPKLAKSVENKDARSFFDEKTLEMLKKIETGKNE